MTSVFCGEACNEIASGKTVILTIFVGRRESTLAVDKNVKLINLWESVQRHCRSLNVLWGRRECITN